VSDPLREGLVGSGSSEVGLVRVERVHESVELADGARHAQGRSEGHPRVAQLETTECAPIDACAFCHLLCGEALELAPRGEVAADDDRGSTSPDRQRTGRHDHLSYGAQMHH
jgi:hypothetical protein